MELPFQSLISPFPSCSSFTDATSGFSEDWARDIGIPFAHTFELRDNGTQGFFPAWSSDPAHTWGDHGSYAHTSWWCVWELLTHPQCQGGDNHNLGTDHGVLLHSSPLSAACLGLLSLSDGNMAEVKVCVVIQKPNHEIKNTLHSNKGSC